MDHNTEQFLAQLVDYLLGHGKYAAANEVADFMDGVDHNQEGAA